MNSTQNGTKLPFSISRHAAARAGMCLVLLLGWAGSTALEAQVVLELEPGAARLWSASAEPERIALGAGRLARAAAAAEGGHVVAGEDLATGDLFFVQQTEVASIELPTPPVRSDRAAPRTAPVLVTRGDRLEGTVWLEGPSPLDSSLLASEWNGTSWESVETVSIHSTGPQLAPSATALEDGSWLLVWAGFDGNDDDIFWSRRSGGAWSEPRRLHPDNRVPDILPTITVGEGGAVAAWSFYDGNDYRVRTARWTGGGWASPELLDGKGPGKPTLESIDGRSFLTFQTVAPAVWNLVELGSEGTERVTTFPDTYPERPLIAVGEDSRAYLAWPWRSEARR